jgi:PQQ-dependent catabolism-associated beta-propeller protein
MRAAQLCMPISILGLLAGCADKPERLYVSAEQDGVVIVVDPIRAAVVSRIPVGKRPRGLKLSHDGKLLFVAKSGSPRGGPNVDESKLPPADRTADGIGVVDVASGRLVTTLPGGQDPESFDLSPDGKLLYVSNEETAELSVLDVEAGKVLHSVPVGKQPEGVTVRPDGKVVYVTSEEDDLVVAVDTQTLKEIARIPTGKRPRSIAFAKDLASTTAFVTNELGASVAVFDTKTHQVQKQIPVVVEGGPEQRPMGAVFSADGKKLFVSTGRGGAVAVIDVGRREIIRMLPAVGARPWGIAVSRDGKRLYTANGPSEDISIIDLASGQTKRVKVGGLPWGVVASGP